MNALIKAIDDLIISLKATNNPTAQYFEKTKDELANGVNVKENLSNLRSCGAIEQYGNYNRDQTAKLDIMIRLI